MTLSGDLSPSLWPVHGVRTGPAALANADRGEAKNMVSASAAEIGGNLLALLSAAGHSVGRPLHRPVSIACMGKRRAVSLAPAPV